MKAWTIVLMLVSMLVGILLAWPAPAKEIPYRGCFDVASRESRIDLDLLLAIASVESDWNPDARSHANAHGIMQIRWPITARHLGVVRVAELYNPCLNIALGARYLRELLDQYHQDLNLALAAYNYGPSRIRERSDIPPLVMKYVQRVSAHRQQIAARFDETVTRRQVVELARFDGIGRARRFASTLQTQAPDVAFDVVEHGGKGIVYVDTGALTPASRYRLSQLIPDMLD